MYAHAHDKRMLTIKDDLRGVDAAAVRGTVDLIHRITETDLARPTPCAGWDLAALLGHMTAQHRGFAAAARGGGGDHAVWEPRAGDSYGEAAEDVLSAFAEEGVLDRPFRMPEIDRPIPGRLAIGFHLVDYVVHGWDVARTIDAAYQPEPAVLAAVLPIVRAVPDGPERLGPQAPFRPALTVPAGADPLTEILLLLGRDPSWPGRNR